MRQILALIPARGGSKGIPRKNIRTFAGFPLIAWAIAAAKQSKLVTRIIVSTDDEKIAKIAEKYGAEVPFLRPAKYARDLTPDLPVFKHALGWLAKNENYIPDIIVQLRPTSPLRPKGFVDLAIKKLLSQKGADSVRSVTPAGQNPFKMWAVSSFDKPMKNLLKLENIAEPFNSPRQILPKSFWQTGHIDVIRKDTILKKHSMSGKKIYPLAVEAKYSVDLDNLEDWKVAESKAKSDKLQLVSP